ncbi:MAG: GNAT family N-acetyltransferase [Oscillospiraceae bacterium]|jgi:predicted acetyltransferase|nr:GNAT family N-acetyltransferase [Oscillospiraceae bacterium]
MEQPVREQLRLSLPDEAYAGDWETAMAELCATGEAIPMGWHAGQATFERMLAFARRMAEGRDLPPHMVQSTNYWLVRVPDNRLVAAACLRHRLNDRLLQRGGHIGYGVRPGERRRGYGTRMLALMLARCAALGIARALVTCDEGNAGSIGVIEKNGGELEDIRTGPDGLRLRRYWIDTAKSADNLAIGVPK